MPWYDSIEYTILCLLESTFPEENNGKLKRLFNESPCLNIEQCMFVPFKKSPGLFLMETIWAISKIASDFHIFGFYPCLRVAGVLKYTLNKYIDQSAAYGVKI